jgi:hypothetical protein
MQTDYPYAIEPYVGVEEAAEFLRVAVGTLRNWCSKFRDTEDSIPYISIGKKSSFRLSELDNFIDFIEKTQITKLPDLSKPLIEEFLAYSGARYFTPNPKRRETGDQKIFHVGNAEPPCARKPHRP